MVGEQYHLSIGRNGIRYLKKRKEKVIHPLWSNAPICNNQLFKACGC